MIAVNIALGFWGRQRTNLLPRPCGYVPVIKGYFSRSLGALTLTELGCTHFLSVCQGCKSVAPLSEGSGDCCCSALRRNTWTLSCRSARSAATSASWCRRETARCRRGLGCSSTPFLVLSASAESWSAADAVVLRDDSDLQKQVWVF